MTTEAVEPIEASNTALLIMDYQNGIIPMAPNPEELLAGARQAIDLLVSEAKPISIEEAQVREASARARDKLWTPGQEDASAGAGPGSSGDAGAGESSPKIWTPGS